MRLALSFDTTSDSQPSQAHSGFLMEANVRDYSNCSDETLSAAVLGIRGDFYENLGNLQTLDHAKFDAVMMQSLLHYRHQPNSSHCH